MTHYVTVGNQFKKTARNVLKYYIDDNVLVNYSCRVGTKTKKIFSALTEVNSAIKLSIRCRNSQYTDYEPAEFMKEYLKQTNSRIAASLKKQLHETEREKI